MGWFAKFIRQIWRNPNLLQVKSRLSPSEVFEDQKQQKFVMPTALLWFAANPDTSLEQLPTVEEPEESETRCEDGMEAQSAERQPILVVPFVPGMSEQLKRISENFGVSTWYTYPGRSMDRFTEHRGRIPFSKTRFSIYGCQCSCGVKYVGESYCNLKVRVSEHLQPSSGSAYSDHLQIQCPRNVTNKHHQFQSGSIIKDFCVTIILLAIRQFPGLNWRIFLRRISKKRSIRIMHC